MASDMKHLQRGLDAISNVVAHDYYGASDRKRALIQIKQFAQEALDGAEGSKIVSQNINGD